MRIHLFEFEDQPWFPDVIRDGGTDYLRYFLIRTALYKPVIPMIREALDNIQADSIIDLCSGGGGYIERVYRDINQSGDRKISIVVTDKFPNIRGLYLSQQKNE